MKISLDWMRDYIDLPDNPDELIDVLPMLGIEVEESEEQSSSNLDHVVVGEVLSKSPHPEADRLSVCSVEVGEARPANIVCGATNFKTGDRVPVALPGAKLPGGFKIKKSKLRGVPSEGMMCSAKELEIGTDDQGLFILPDKPTVGTPIAQLFSSDKVLELEITANRGDCLSYIGIAREISAYYQKDYKTPPISDLGKPHKECPAGHLLQSVRIESEDCARYGLWSIQGVTIAPSPEWLQAKLESVGLRPINNVVDITNFVLLETGQPLHAFDASKIKGSTIRVRQAEENESITTLDGVERKLVPGMTVIADAEAPLVIAGVMGSVDAEVENSTTNIVLESAWFRPGSIRQTARKLGLHTDSSQRFSRDVDPEMLEYAAQRAIDLIIEIAGGECHSDYVLQGEAPRGKRSIEITHAFAEKICGFGIEAEQLSNSWKRLGFSVSGNDPWTVMVPSFRSEVERPIDLVEEFLRIHGTDKLVNNPVLSPSTFRENDGTYEVCHKATDNLVGQGFQEVCNYSLRSGEEINSWHPHFETEKLALLNPLTSDHTHVRASLLPGLIDNLAHNQKNLNDLTRVFETGRVFRPGPRGNSEWISIAFACFAEPNSRQWKAHAKIDFFALKDQFLSVLHATGLTLPKGEWQNLAECSPWQSDYSAQIGDAHRNKLEATIGILDLQLTKKKEAKGPVFAVEILIDPILLSKKKKAVTFAHFSTFPPAIKDLALVVDQDIPAESVRLDLEQIAKSVGGDKFEVDPVTIFDLFQGQGMETNKKSVACSMRFRAPDRTLSEKEVNQAFDSILEKVNQDTPYELRK